MMKLADMKVLETFAQCVQVRVLLSAPIYEQLKTERFLSGSDFVSAPYFCIVKVNRKENELLLGI